MRDRFAHPAWLLILVPVVWIALWHNLGDASLHTSDEAAHTDVARNMWSRGSFTDLWYFERPYVGKPPLKIWLVALLMKVLGSDEWVLRIPDALAGTLTTLLLWAMARRLVGGPATLAAPLIFVTAPYPLVLHGWRESVQDAPLTFLMALAAYCYLRFVDAGDSPNRYRWLAGVGLSVAAGGLVKSVVSFLIFLPIGLDLLTRRRWRSLTAAVGVGIVSWVPWFIWHLPNLYGEVVWNLGARVDGWGMESPHPASAYWVWLSGGFHPWGSFGAQWIGIGPLIPLAGLVLLWGTLRGRWEDRWILMWGLCLTVPWLFAEVKHAWYHYPAYPVVGLALARLLLPPEAWLRSRRTMGHTLFMVVGGVAFLVGARAQVLEARRIANHPERAVLDEAVEWLQTLPDERIAVHLDPRGICPDERYYFDLAGGDTVYVPDLTDLMAMALQEEQLIAFLPRDELPELIRTLDLVRGETPVKIAYVWPRCRRAKDLGRLPVRYLVAIGYPEAPLPFTQLPSATHWDGFYPLEENAGGTFGWIKGKKAKLWFPFGTCGELDMKLVAYHRDNRLRVLVPGSRQILPVPFGPSQVSVPIDVPVGGAFGDLAILDGCVSPHELDPAKPDDRCLGVSIGSLEIRPDGQRGSDSQSTEP